MKQSRIKSKVPHSHKFHVNTKETLGGAIFKKRTPFLNNTLQDGQISPKLTCFCADKQTHNIREGVILKLLQYTTVQPLISLRVTEL